MSEKKEPIKPEDEPGSGELELHELEKVSGGVTVSTATHTRAGADGGASAAGLGYGASGLGYGGIGYGVKLPNGGENQGGGTP